MKDYRLILATGIALLCTVVLPTNVYAQFKRVLEEEYTGTRCGWCPRGMVGMELVKEEFGDSVILISIHGKKLDPSPMAKWAEDAGYGKLAEDAPGYPTCAIDRGKFADPYFGFYSSGFGMRDVIKSQLAAKCEADVNLKAVWADAQRNSIEATSDFKFVSRKNAKYAVAYVLCADSIMGEDEEWNQLNFYAGEQEDDPNLQPFTMQPRGITNVVYDNVAIAGVGVENGIENSIEYPVNVGKEYVHTQSIEIPSLDGFVLDKDKLRMVVMLINTKSKEIVNAAEATISSANIVDNIALDQKPSIVARYNMSGQTVSASAKGLVILRYSDGKTQKTWIP